MKKTTIALLCFFLLPALSLPAQEGAFPSDPVAVDSVTLAQKKAASQAQKERISAYLSMTFPGRVTSVRVSDSKVRIRGRRPGGKNYFLAEITPWEDIDPQALGGELIPLRCRRFCRSVPRTVTRDGGTYDRSLSRWAVVEKTEGDGLALRSHARYADAVKPVRKATKMVLDGKKGLGGYGMNRNFYEDLDSLGIRSVTININLNGMVYSQERPGAIRKDFGGRTFWFDSSRVAYLDRVLTYCTERGVITSAITLIGLRSADPALTPVFRHPSCDGGFFTMPNMTSAEGVNAYAAVLDFLAERYSTGEHGRINNWIVHNEVDYGIGWTNMGPEPYELYMDAYEKSIRLNWNIVRKYDQNAWVLGSYTHNWTVPEDEKGFLVRSMLEDHVRYSNAEGDFPWGIAQHPYPQNLAAPRFWAEDTKTTWSLDSKYLTFKNLEVIDKWIKMPEHFYKGEKRLLFLSENGTNSPSYSEEDLRDQAAGACWAWKKVEALDGIDAIQWHAWIDNRGEFGLRIGLRRYPDDETIPGGIKPAWEVWKAAGTSSEDEVFDPYLEVMGLKDWSEIFHSVE